MSGPLFLNPLMPTADSQAATKAYVDAMLATAGIPEVPPVPVGQIWGRETGQWTPISQAEGTFLPITGGSMQGNINMSGNTLTNMAAVPAMPNGAAPAQWVLNQIASVSLYQGTWNADTNTPDLTQLSTHVNAYTWIALTTSPSGVVIGAAIPGLQGQTVFNGDTIIYSTVAGAFSSIHSGGITLPEADGRYVQLAGSQMSGALLLNSDATQNMQAVPFQQLEAAVANTVTPDAPADGQAYLRVGVGTNRWVPGLPLAGGILTGSLTLAGNATTTLMPVPLQQMTSAITAGTAGLLPIAGGTMTGPIILAGNATVNLNPVPLQQLNSMLGSYMPVSGGTFSGPVTLPAGSTLAGYLPLSGGTLSGALTLSSGINASLVTIDNTTNAASLALTSPSACTIDYTIGSDQAQFYADTNYTGLGFTGTFGSSSWRFGFQRSTTTIVFWSNTNAVLLTCDGVGHLSIAGTLTQGSDQTNKTNVNPITQGISLIRQLLPKSFAFNAAPDVIQWGFIAQDVQPVIPTAVSTTANNTLGLDINGILAAVTYAVKQLDQRCTALEAAAGITPPPEALA